MQSPQSHQTAAANASETKDVANWLVSCVDNARTKTTQHYEPAAIVERIRSGSLSAKVARVRDFADKFDAASTKAERDALKTKLAGAKESLPGVIWSATLKTRNAKLPLADKLIEHSGLLCADLDKLGAQLSEVRGKLKADSHVWALFTSPSGRGLKAVFRVVPDNNYHLRSFLAVKKHVNEVCGVDVDASCDGVERLCFLSHDPDIYFNEKADVLLPVDLPDKSDSAPAVTNEELIRRREIACDILSDIDWRSDAEGFCECPGKEKHTAPDKDKDCIVYVDSSPTVSCFHNSCAKTIEVFNYTLRSRIGKANKTEKSKPEPRVCRLVDLKAASADDPNTLLGNRFLCRGGGLMLNGSAGIGKSTATIQAGMHWSIGRECFGIKPSKPLKVLYIQAENDEGDLAEMRDGALQSLGDLAEGERCNFENNFVCVFEACRTGAEFVEKTAQLVTTYAPDLAIIDPALSYIGGDANQQEVVGGFLRNNLNPVLQQHGCAAVIVHHTPKPRPEGNGRYKVSSDFAHAGTGSAEWGNWARASLTMTMLDDSGLMQIRAGKRGGRIGWTDGQGRATLTKLVRQNREIGGGLSYRELTADEQILETGDADPTLKVLRSGILPDEGERVEKQLLIAQIARAKICGEKKARSEVIPLLIGDGYLETKDVPRTSGRPAIELVRTPKKHNVVSFVDGAT